MRYSYVGIKIYLYKSKSKQFKSDYIKKNRMGANIHTV